MHLLFLDESGTPPNPAKARGAYFVIGSLVIPEGAWHAIAKDYWRLKLEFNLQGEVKWRHYGSHNIAKGNILSALTAERREEFRRRTFALICARRAVKAICCVTSVEAAYGMKSITDRDDVYHLTYKAITERFQYFLQDATKESGQNQYGMIVADHRMGDDDKKLRSHHHLLVDDKQPFTSKYKNFIESINFAPSDATVGLQLADMIAGAVHRYYQYGDDRFIKQVEPAFRTSQSGEIMGFGVVHMPKGAFIMPSGGGAEAPPTR